MHRSPVSVKLKHIYWDGSPIYTVLLYCTLFMGCGDVFMCDSSGQPPSLPELVRLKIPQQIGTNYSMFGIILLNDQMGSRLQALKQACLGNPEDTMLSILQEWLQGKGLPVTWESLFQTLRDVDLSVLADQIQTSKIIVFS